MKKDATFSEVISEYSKAVQENIEASHAETLAKDRRKKAYDRLIRAKDLLRAKERELLTDVYVV